MATNINLPSSLSHLLPLIEGFTYQKGTENIQINTISGEVQTRKRNIKQNDILQVTYRMNATELNDFNNFYETTLESGTRTFNLTHPIFATAIEVKIINQGDQAYTVVNIGGNNNELSMNLEVL